jgi:sulfonate transport system substrate-binding protein
MVVAAGVLKDLAYTIEWSEFPAAQPLLEAIGAGAVDVGLVGDAPFQFAYQSGSPIRAVAAQRAPDPVRDALAVVVPRTSAAQNLADLRDGLVATTRGSVGHFLVLRALQRAGLPADFVRFSFLTPGDAKAAFSSGAVAAWATWLPYLTAALAEGARSIVDGENLVRGYGFEVANIAAIASRRALLRDFLAREAKALAWAAAHVDDYAVVLARETRLPLPVARTMAVKNRRLSVPIDGGVIADQNDVFATFAAAGEVRGRRQLAQGFERGLVVA